MPRVGFEPTISAGKRPKTYALDRAATGTGTKLLISQHNSSPCIRWDRYGTSKFTVISFSLCPLSKMFENFRDFKNVRIKFGDPNGNALRGK